MGDERRLNAILFADIAGYTSLMQKDEQSAKEIIQRFRNIIEENVPKYYGRIINFMGDGCLCVFESSVNSLECSLDLQSAFLQDPFIPVRIGIHSGDVYFENDTVYGDSVNIASRIESIGVPSSIIISERIYNDIQNHRSFVVKPLGQVKFKNVTHPLKIYALANSGLKVPDPKNIRGKIDARPKRRVNSYLAIISMLIILGSFGYLVVNRGNFGGADSNIENQKVTVAVMNFENRTGENNYNILPEIITDRFINGISQLDIARVLSGETIKDYENIMMASSVPTDRMDALHEEFGVNRVIQGQIYQIGENIRAECTITDPVSKEILYATPTVSLDADDPMQGIEELRQYILSSLIVDKDRMANLLLETKPPNFEAYKALLQAKEKEDDAEMIDLLNKAIALDSLYFEPKLLRISGNYNLGNFAKADSLTRALNEEMLEAIPRQKNLLNFYKALLSGQNNLTYYHFNEELKLAPFDMMSNNTTMVLATDFINNVQKAFDIYDIIDEGKLDFANCAKCRTRLYIKMYMDLEVGDYKNALRLGKIMEANGAKSRVEKLRVRAWIRSGKLKELNEYIEEQDILEGTDKGSLFLYAAKEAGVDKNKEQEEFFISAALNSVDKVLSDFRRGELFLMNKDYLSAQESFRSFLSRDQSDIESLSYLAASHFLNNQVEKAKEILDSVERMRQPYQYGSVDYYLARYYCIIGEYDMALKALKSSIMQGQRVGYHQFHNDYWLTPIHNRPEFKEILTYWHK